VNAYEVFSMVMKWIVFESIKWIQTYSGCWSFFKNIQRQWCTATARLQS